LRKIEISSLINEENSQTTRYYFWDDELCFVFHESVAPQMIEKNEMIYHYYEKEFILIKEIQFAV